MASPSWSRARPSASRTRAARRQSRLLSDRRDRAAAAAGRCRHAAAPTIPSPSTRSAAIPAAAEAMIEAHESTGGPAFELYALGLEHKHVPETQHYGAADAAADLRALGRAFPPGHAGLGAAASRPAAGQRRPAPTCTTRSPRATMAASWSACAAEAVGRARARGAERHRPAGAARLRQRRARGTPCWSRGSTISARARRARRCRTCG